LRTFGAEGLAIPDADTSFMTPIAKTAQRPGTAKAGAARRLARRLRERLRSVF
jgi:hypothetical protein